MAMHQMGVNFFFKQKTAYEIYQCDWSSDVCSSDLIHSAKGCEWSAVYLLHAADGNLPSDMAIDDAAGLDEELRLAYVAVTRAKTRLNVTFPMRYHVHRHGRDDRHHYAQLSRFFEPIRDRFELGVAGAPEVAGASMSTDRVEIGRAHV